MIHPASLSIEDLMEHCKWTFGRASGPGGQNRNKVETSAIVIYLPLDVSAQACERRSQAENRAVAVQRLRCKLAISVRSRQESVEPTKPSQTWLKYCRSSRINVSESNEDWPAVLAELLDVVHRHGGDLSIAAERLQTTSSQLVKLLKKEPEAFRTVSEWRAASGLGPLK